MTKCPQYFYLICLIWQLSSSTIQYFEAETLAELEVKGYQKYYFVWCEVLTN